MARPQSELCDALSLLQDDDLVLGRAAEDPGDAVGDEAHTGALVECFCDRLGRDLDKAIPRHVAEKGRMRDDRRAAAQKMAVAESVDRRDG